MKRKKPSPVHHHLGKPAVLALLVAVILQTGAFTYFGTPMQADLAGFFDFMARFNRGEQMDIDSLDAGSAKSARQQPRPPVRPCADGQFCMTGGQQFACPNGGVLEPAYASCTNQAGRTGECYACADPQPSGSMECGDVQNANMCAEGLCPGTDVCRSVPESVYGGPACRCFHALPDEPPPFGDLVICEQMNPPATCFDPQVPLACPQGMHLVTDGQSSCLFQGGTPGRCGYCQADDAAPPQEACPDGFTCRSAGNNYCPDTWQLAEEAGSCEGGRGICYRCPSADTPRPPFRAEENDMSEAMYPAAGCAPSFDSVFASMGSDERAALENPAGSSIGVLLKAISQFPDTLTLEQVRGNMQACGY